MARPARRLILAGAAAALALGGCDRLGGLVGGSTPGFKAVDITGAQYAKDFDLADGDGRRWKLADFSGKVTVVFFGFTQCPDVCPTTMIELAEVKQRLGADGARVQGVFVTIDPERDTPEVLKAYVANFGAGFVGLRGSAEETAAIAKHFKVYYNKVPGKTPTSYTMDHTAGSYVFDASGRVRLFTRHGTGPDALVHDLKILLAEKPAA